MRSLTGLRARGAVGHPRYGIAELGFAVVTLIYGGLHATAWYSDFPTHGERDLWRSAAVAIITSSLAVISWVLLRRWNPETPMKLETGVNDEEVVVDDEGWLWTAGRAVLIAPPALLFCTACIAYPMARVYITVESFCSLRRLPATAYDTPAWTNLLWH